MADNDRLGATSPPATPRNHPDTQGALGTRQIDWSKWGPPLMVSLISLVGLFTLRECDNRDELLRENMDLKFEHINESIEAVRGDIAGFQDTYDARITFLERERMREGANAAGSRNSTGDTGE